MKKVFALLFITGIFNLFNLAQGQIPQTAPTPAQLGNTQQNYTQPPPNNTAGYNNGGNNYSNQHVVITGEVASLQKEAYDLNYKFDRDVIDITPRQGENNQAYVARLKNEIHFQKAILEEGKRAYKKGKADAQQESNTVSRQRDGSGALIAVGLVGAVLGAAAINNRPYGYGGGYYRGGGYYNGNYGGYVSGYNSNYYGYRSQGTYHSPRYGPQRTYP